MWTAATLLCAFAATFEQLFLMRFGVGLGEAALVPLAISLIGAYIPRQQLGTANGLFFAGATVGKALSFIGGGFALTVVAAAGGLAIAGHLFKPWQALFLLAALPGILATVLLLTIREPARRGPAAPSEPEAKADTGAFLAHLRAHGRTYALLIAGSCGLHMSAASVAAWVVSFYVRDHGMSLESAATAAGLIGLVGGVVGALVGGVVVDALIKRGVRGAPVLFIAGTLLIGAPAAYVAFHGTGSLAISFAAYVVVHTTNLAGGPQTFAAVQHVTPLPFRGFMSAILVATITLLSLTVGPLLIGILSDTGGSEGGLGRAMAISVALQNLVGAALLLAARKSFDRTIRSMN
jgi:MFS family permease